MSSSSFSCNSIGSEPWDDDSDNEIEGVENCDEAKTGNDLAALSQPEGQQLGKEEAPIEVEGVEEVPAPTQASQGGQRKRRRRGTSAATGTSRKKSIVWNHFEKQKRILYTEKDGKKVAAGHEQIAICIHCGGEFQADSTFNGTSSLLRHIQKVCKMYPGREVVDEGQQNLVGDGGEDETLTQQKPWSNDRCIRAACEMIVIDELPFSHVEKEGFRHFCKVAVPIYSAVKKNDSEELLGAV